MAGPCRIPSLPPEPAACMDWSPEHREEWERRRNMEDLNLPEIKKRNLEKKVEDKREFKDLFESDSDSESCAGGLSLKAKSKSKSGADSSDEDSDLSSEGEEGEYEVEDDDDNSDFDGESQDEEDDEEEAGDAGAQKKKIQKKGPQRLSQADLKELAKGEEDIVQDLEFSDDE
ncbi:unnamed protein product [Ranitomeya imitator]|uniref:Uncharacterized protein n=1 Tax=Ranitomeya imitator TaxID=111125 RepID=A0ABN9LU29_9NEOB|nr:unnamed protein product [Ranitomeya imitator]